MSSAGRGQGAKAGSPHGLTRLLRQSYDANLRRGHALGRDQPPGRFTMSKSLLSRFRRAEMAEKL